MTSALLHDIDTVLIHAFEYVFKVNHEKLVLSSLKRTMKFAQF